MVVRSTGDGSDGDEDEEIIVEEEQEIPGLPVVHESSPHPGLTISDDLSAESGFYSLPRNVLPITTIGNSHYLFSQFVTIFRSRRRQ